MKTKAVASSGDVYAGETSCEDLGAWREVGEGGYIFLAFYPGEVFFEDLCRRRAGKGELGKEWEVPKGGKFSWRWF